ncbi:MAG: TetR/AcrR family transcriptional regulator [Alphaproteobacteria bacterium]|nr:TetR/AcrR family transcriptional regulator [Alphaproteobacteria bacterium SS10]
MITSSIAGAMAVSPATTSGPQKPMPRAKAKILEAAQSLMVLNGYHGTGTDAIIAKAKVAKGSFFYHFADKPALIPALLEDYVEQGLIGPMRKAFKDHAKPVDALIAYVDEVEHWYGKDGFRGGCLLGNLALEVTDSDAQAQRVIAQQFDRWRNLMAEMLEGATLSLPLEQFITLYIAVVEGVTMTIRAHKDRGKAKAEFEACRQLVRMAFSR